MDSSDIGYFGHAVRARRAELGITMDQLAEASGVSRGTLSRIENNALSTSLANAIAIAGALSSDLSALLSPPRATFVPAGDAPTYTDDAGISRTSLARPDPGIELIKFVIPPKATSAQFAAHAESTSETLHVISGKVTYEFDGQEYSLETGDTLTARADRPHRFSNPGGTTCVLHMISASAR